MAQDHFKEQSTVFHMVTVLQIQTALQMANWSTQTHCCPRPQTIISQMVCGNIGHAFE